MAKYDLSFIDCIDCNYRLKIEQSEYTHPLTDLDTKTIDIEIYHFDRDGLTFSMDISTAIKVAKTLRTEINKAKEVDNG